MPRRGWVTLFRWRQAPIRAHVLFFVMGIFLLGAHGWDALVVVTVSMLLHEMGHAVLVRRAGAWVESIDLALFFGLCRWQGTVSSFQRALIAWGGVAANALLAAIACAVGAALSPPPQSSLGRALSVTVAVNFAMVVFNLLPVPIFDGWRAWPIIPMLWRRTTGELALARARRRLRAARERSDEPPRTLQ